MLMFIRNKDDLVKEVAKDLEKTNSEVSAVINSFFEKIKDTLDKDGMVRMKGLIKFEVITRQATIKRNPRTGVKVNVPVRKIAKARCGSFFKI